MADVYGRLTGRAGVCPSTLGRGATKLVTGVADADMDRAPLVALTGQAGRDRMHKESHQHPDIVSLFRPITKWNASLRTPGIIPEVFRKAFKLARCENPGATHIEIPEDVLLMETDGRPLLVQAPQAGCAAPGQTEIAARILSEAARPVVLAGNGVIRGDASGALVRSAERLNNDQSYGLIRWKQMMRFGRPAFVDLRNPDLVRYAESFGVPACRIGSAAELGPALREALGSGRLTVIDCPVDASENLRLTERHRG